MGVPTALMHLDLTLDPSAYTNYSFFEWSLIFLDISFDSVLAADLRESGLRVRGASIPAFSF